MKIKATVIIPTVLSIVILPLALASIVLAYTEQSVSPYGTFAGQDAGASNSGSNNTFFGYHAGNVNTTGHENTCVGGEAGIANTSGSMNTFIGCNGGSNTSGNSNTFIGCSTGDDNSIDSCNTYIGYAAGTYIAGGGNIAIGNWATLYESVNVSNILFIDYAEDAPLIYGEFDNQLVQINDMLVFASDERLKKDIEPLKSSLDRVMHLSGVSFEWKAEEERGKGRQIGFIAEDVESVIPELVATDRKGLKSLSYDRFVPFLIEAIKEQQALMREQNETLASKSIIIDDQRERLAKQKAVIRELATKLASLKSDVNLLLESRGE